MFKTLFTSLSSIGNIDEQTANPAGVRRVGVVAIADLRPEVIEWPRTAGEILDLELDGITIRAAVPLKQGAEIAIITPADNSAFMSFENQGDRYYQSYKHSLGLDLAGLTKDQAKEMRKYINTGCIFFLEGHDGSIRVVGSKLCPIVLKQKGDTGKKGGDKRGYTLSGDNDSFNTEPPFYPNTLPLPGIWDFVPGGFSYGFSLAFTS